MGKLPRSLKLAIALLILVLIGLCISITANLFKTEQLHTKTRNATREASQRLFAIHGQEVGDAIENFEVGWHSLDVRREPETLSNIATGRYLEQRLETVQDSFPEQDEWQVVESAVIKRLYIYEFDLARFKAGACLEEKRIDVNSGGEFLRSVSHGESCGVFVFVSENGTWKMAGFFYTNLPYSSIHRDWHQLPSWLKDIMGDIPDDIPMPNSLSP